MAEGQYVAYYRVSTARQGRSGLGLDAQRKAVADFLNGGSWALVGEFTEVESGKRNGRPQLHRALAACRLRGARLVVARLDRLSRNVAFLLTLRDAGADFVAVDMPEANELTVGLMAVIAQAGRETISKNTREALAAAKARGVVLGKPENMTPEGRVRGRAASLDARRATAAQRARDLKPTLDELRAEGHTSLRQLAAGLNARGIPAPRGGRWTAAGVQRVLARIGAR